MQIKSSRSKVLARLAISGVIWLSQILNPGLVRAVTLEQLEQQRQIQEAGESPGGMGAGVGAPAPPPAGDPVDSLLEKLGKSLTSGSADQKWPTPGSDSALAPANSCDPAFLEEFYRNWIAAICRDTSNYKACGKFNWSPYLMAAPMVLGSLGMEATLLLTQGNPHGSLNELKGVVESSPRDMRGVFSHDALSQLVSEARAAESKGELRCILRKMTAEALGTSAEQEAARIEQRVNKARKMGYVTSTIRYGLLAGNVAGGIAMGSAVSGQAQQGSECRDVMPEDQYFDPAQADGLRVDSSYIPMSKSPTGCVPSYRMDPKIVKFLDLPYLSQRKLLSERPAVCKYYRGLNDRIVMGTKPAGTLEAIRGPRGSSTLEFSVQRPTGRVTYSLDLNLANQGVRTLRITQAGTPEGMVFHFTASRSPAGGAEIQALGSVELIDGSGKRRTLPLSKIKGVYGSKGDAAVQDADSLYRDFRYYRPIVDACIENGYADRCPAALKPLLAD